MMVIVSISCSTAKTAADDTEPAGKLAGVGGQQNWYCRHDIGDRQHRTPHAHDVGDRARGRRAELGAGANPGGEPRRDEYLHQNACGTDGEHVAGWPRQPLTGVSE